jgi:hypothetical protein
MKGLKYKIIGIVLIFGIGGIIAAFIFIPAGDGGERQRAEDFLKAAIGAQNARIVYDAYEIQKVLQSYYDTNNQYPQTLVSISNDLVLVQGIDVNSPEVYKQIEGGASYMITYTLKDGRIFELGPEQSAIELEDEARSLPADYKLPEEQIQQMIAENRKVDELLKGRK